MGISTKKSSSKTVQDTKLNTTPTNPQFTTDLISGLAGKIPATFDAIDPYSLVPGAHPLQQQAAASAANLGFGGGLGGGQPSAPGLPPGLGEPGWGGNPADKEAAKAASMVSEGGRPTYDFGGASPLEGMPSKYDVTAGRDPRTISLGYTGPPDAAPSAGGFDPYASSMGTLQGISGAGPQSVDRVNIADSIAGFRNPFEEQVVNASLGNFDEGAGFTRAENKLALAGDSTFGGSGGAIQTALSERGLADDRARLAADLRSSGYDRAVQAAMAQAGLDSGRNLSNAQFGESALNRRMAAAQGLAGVGSAQQENERANINTQANLGGSLRDIDATKARAPIDMLLQQIMAASGLPLDLFKGSSATGSLNATTKGKESGASLGDWLGYMAANLSAGD